jgi:hypothetical protein
MKTTATCMAKCWMTALMPLRQIEHRRQAKMKRRSGLPGEVGRSFVEPGQRSTSGTTAATATSWHASSWDVGSRRMVICGAAASFPAAAAAA